jgi:hypothetical protein
MATMSSQPIFHTMPAPPSPVRKPTTEFTHSSSVPELSREERRIVLESMADHLESCAGDSLSKRQTARRYRAMAASLHGGGDGTNGTEGGSAW